MNSLLTAAALPVIGLCYFIYTKDQHREPTDFLLKLLGLGALMVIPIIAVELMLGNICETKGVINFFEVFIKVFFGVALAEEGFKWLVVKLKAYDNQEFDEIYDIIVYSVFVSLGFALVENILYVAQGGYGVAILRAILSVPGHACFAVFMGYYLSKAKIADLNNSKRICIKNMAFSLIMPMLFHTMYDALLMTSENLENNSLVIPFLIFDVIMVIICFIIVNKTSKVQQNLTENLEAGSIVNNNGQISLAPTQAAATSINFCPLCGNNVQNSNFCSKCGMKIR